MSPQLAFVLGFGLSFVASSVCAYFAYQSFCSRFRVVIYRRGYEDGINESDPEL